MMTEHDNDLECSDLTCRTPDLLGTLKTMNGSSTEHSDKQESDSVALVSAYIPVALRRRLKVECARRDVTTSSFVAAALAAALVDAEP